MLRAVTRIPDGRRPDAVVVLGAQVLRSGRPSASLRRRLEHGVSVWRRFPEALLVVAGGVGGAPISEAEAMRRMAEAAGVPPERIVPEDRSRSTMDQAVEVARLAGIHGWGHLVVVTDRYHSPRALFLFGRLGLAATGDPVRGRGGGSRRRWVAGALREIPAWGKAVLLVAAGSHRRRRRSAG
jgi:uncharacterized SAM-binding protein YcdF (DUF218 family)